METLKYLLSFAVDISWQIIVVLIVILLRNELRQMFMRLQQARIPGAGEYKFYQPEPRYVEKPRKEEGDSESTANWDNVANLYWVGYDVMSAMDAVLRFGNREDIMYGLKQARHHLRELNLSDKSPENDVLRIINSVEDKLETEPDVTVRRSIARDIATLRDQIGVIVEAKQKNFLSSPDGRVPKAAERLALTS